MRCASFDEYRKRYLKLLGDMCKYTAGEAGSHHFAEKLSDLVEQNPSEWEARTDAEREEGEVV